MSNKVSNHKLTVLSVSLLVLFLGGCGGGSGGVNTAATIVNVGTGAGSSGSGAGTDGSATTDGGGTPPKPEVKTPELEKVDNPNVPKKDLLGAEKPYTELSGYSFNAGFQDASSTDPILVKETKGLLAEEESEGANSKEKVPFKSTVKTYKDGKTFTPQEGVEKVVENVNTEGDDYPINIKTHNEMYITGADQGNWKGGDNNTMYIFDFSKATSIGVLRYLTSPTVRESVFFYRAKEPDSRMPIDGKVTYNGLWLYATKAFDNGKGLLQSGEYRDFTDNYTDSSKYPTISLTADFVEKKVTGDFKSKDNLSLKIKSAPIKGNSFSGVAEVTRAEDSNYPNHYVGILSKGDEVNLKGAFYGSAQSIGGYLSKDKDGEQVFAGVFAGKEDLSTKEAPTKYEDVKPAKNNLPYVDSILKIDQASGNVDLSTPQFTGDIDKLNLGDNVGVSLGNITDTGIDFQFLRLSNFAKDDSGYKFNQASLGQNGDTGYFIQGYLTPDSDMNKLIQTYSKVYYAGKWLGWGKSDNNTTSAHYADARYVFDFNNGDKVLNGYLYKPGSTNVSTDVKEDIKKAEESVRSKTFEGIALYTHVDGNSFHTNDNDHTSKINLDGVTGEVKAEGHFFGTQANPGNEIGGTVVGVGDTKFGGVFAGKQVKGVSEKR